jgi:hypothetical protein
MLPVHYFDPERAQRHAAQRAVTAEERSIQAKRARRRAVFVTAIAAVIVIAASFHAHRVLAAHTPNDMPANSRWILTGRDRASNDKLGLWIGCWKSTIKEVDHCRITNEKGIAEFDGDMLPLTARHGAVPDRNLQLAAKIKPDEIWVRGVNYDLPVAVLPLADGTLLVPVSDREGLQKRLASGAWDEGMEPAQPTIAEDPVTAE